MPSPKRKNAAPSQALAVQRKDEILQRLEPGEFASDIARSLGLTPGAVTHQLGEDPAYKAARQAGADRRLTEDYGDLRGASDAFKLARARECFRASSWFAEREFPERWGSKAINVTVNTTNVDQAVIVSASDLLETVAQKRHAAVLPASELDSGTGEDTAGSSD